MRTSWKAVDSISALVLLSLVPQTLARPASALFGHGLKSLPVNERRDSLIDRRDSATSFDGTESSRYHEHAHQRVYKNDDEDDDEDTEQADAIELLVRELDYETANDAALEFIEKRQISSSTSGPSVVVRAAVTTVGKTVYPSGAPTMTAIITPSIVSFTVLGQASHSPAMSYLSGVKHNPIPTLSPTLLTEYQQGVVDPVLESNYAMNNATGTLIINTGNENRLAPLQWKPSYSRDQGKGGMVNGVSIFLFADTNSYSAPNSKEDGNFTGFTGNSMAIDKGLTASTGNPITISDPAGVYAGQSGNLRPWVPMTLGESGFNSENNHGQRFAIWPESSIIPLNPTTGLLYAPIVYVNASGNGNGVSFNYAGTTLMEVTVPSIGGPVATRVAPRLFPQGVEWGCVGGIRAFGPNGIDGGKVYVMGNHKNGILLGRTDADTVTDASTYEYWQKNGTWTYTVPNKNSTDNFVNASFSTVDVFYSPRHLTFLMVYQDPFEDNDFYWRYLVATKPILPNYAGGKDTDIVETMTTYAWSKAILLAKLPTPGSQYAYGGGMHPGYFMGNDITRGGKKMLLTWTAPTGLDAGSLASGYATMSAVAIFA